MEQNPSYDHSPYQTNPLPLLPSYHQNQGPSYNLPPQFQYYYPSPSVDRQNAPPPPQGFELPMPVTVTVSYVPIPSDPNMSWAAADYPQSAPYSAGVTLPSATQIQNMNNVLSFPKKTKSVQSQRCEICKIDCNSTEVLDKHREGKKHKKNLDRLRGPPYIPPAAPATLSATLISLPAAPTALPVSPAMASSNSFIGPIQKPVEATNSNGKKRKKAAANDIETKKQKVLEGGAAAEAIRTCTVCNVVCNSDKVFRSHMDGQKHATMVRKRDLLLGSAAAVRG